MNCPLNGDRWEVGGGVLGRVWGRGGGLFGREEQEGGGEPNTLYRAAGRMDRCSRAIVHGTAGGRRGGGEPINALQYSRRGGNGALQGGETGNQSRANASCSS